MPLPKVSIYTDGACIGNPGKGGCAAILRAGGREKELSAGYKRTTNNRMEMLALIMALEALTQPCEVELWTDSMIVVYGVNDAGRKKRKKERPNTDLWLRIYALMAPHQITANWVKGHAGHPENERCDEMAGRAARGTELLEDVGMAPGADLFTTATSES